jgi:hypothetical protein
MHAYFLCRLPACSSINGGAAQYSEMIGTGRRHQVNVLQSGFCAGVDSERRP